MVATKTLFPHSGVLSKSVGTDGRADGRSVRRKRANEKLRTRTSNFATAAADRGGDSLAEYNTQRNTRTLTYGDAETSRTTRNETRLRIHTHTYTHATGARTTRLQRIPQYNTSIVCRRLRADRYTRRRCHTHAPRRHTRAHTRTLRHAHTHTLARASYARTRETRRLLRRLHRHRLHRRRRCRRRRSTRSYVPPPPSPPRPLPPPTPVGHRDVHLRRLRVLLSADYNIIITPPRRGPALERRKVFPLPNTYSTRIHFSFPWRALNFRPLNPRPRGASDCSLLSSYCYLPTAMLNNFP